MLTFQISFSAAEYRKSANSPVKSPWSSVVSPYESATARTARNPRRAWKWNGGNGGLVRVSGGGSREPAGSCSTAMNMEPRELGQKSSGLSLPFVSSRRASERPKAAHLPYSLTVYGIPSAKLYSTTPRFFFGPRGQKTPPEKFNTPGAPGGNNAYLHAARHLFIPTAFINNAGHLFRFNIFLRSCRVIRHELKNKKENGR